MNPYKMVSMKQALSTFEKLLVILWSFLIASHRTFRVIFYFKLTLLAKMCHQVSQELHTDGRNRSDYLLAIMVTEFYLPLIQAFNSFDWCMSDCLMLHLAKLI